MKHARMNVHRESFHAEATPEEVAFSILVMGSHAFREGILTETCNMGLWYVFEHGNDSVAVTV